MVGVPGETGRLFAPRRTTGAPAILRRAYSLGIMAQRYLQVRAGERTADTRRIQRLFDGLMAGLRQPDDREGGR